MNSEKCAELTMKELDIVYCILAALINENRDLMSNDCDPEVDELDSNATDFMIEMENFRGNLVNYIEYRKKAKEAEDNGDVTDK